MLRSEILLNSTVELMGIGLFLLEGVSAVQGMKKSRVLAMLADQDSTKHLLGTQNVPNALHTAQPTWKQRQSVIVKRVTSGQKKTHLLWHALDHLQLLEMWLLTSMKQPLFWNRAHPVTQEGEKISHTV